VVVDGETRGLCLGGARIALGARRVEIPPGPGAVVAGDVPLAPPEVVDRRDVGQEVEALFVAKVDAGIDDPRRVDDERRLAERILALDEARDAFEGQLATPRTS
jgi:hypothetical protein